MTWIYLTIALLGGYSLLSMAIRDIRQAWGRERAWRSLEAFLVNAGPQLTPDQLQFLGHTRWDGD